MFHPLFRRLFNILILTAVLIFGISYYRPISYTHLPRFDASKLSSYLNGTNPFGYEPEPVPECAPISTTTAYKTTRTKRFTTTSVSSVVVTKTESFTAVQSVTVTRSTVVMATQACTCPVFPEHPTSNLDSTPISSGEQHIAGDTASLEQATVAKMREEGIVIIFKTGAQEVSQLAIQVGTTLRYLSETDILFFSDQQGSIGPFLINDALRNVDQNLKLKDDDFEIYREIRKFQQTGQDIQQLNEDKSKGDGRSGWVLDKYKFIHMVEETFEMRPNAKWYVFIETDSYVFWDNLVEWLKRLDSWKPMYLGSQVVIGDTAFAHGGSGYVLSNAAMNKLLGPEQPQGLAASWDSKMKDVCCGDLALGIALKEQGVNINVAHPLLNGYKPTTFTYGPDNHWCQPVVTMHHILPHEVSAIWRFERRREMLGISNATIFADLYVQFVEPHLTSSRDNWDNLSHGREYSQKIQDEAALYKKKTSESEARKKQEIQAKKKAEAEKIKKEEEARKQKLEPEREKQRKPSEGQKKLKNQESPSKSARRKPTVTPAAKEVEKESATKSKSASEAEIGSVDLMDIDDISKAIEAQKASLNLEGSRKLVKRLEKREEEEPQDRTTKYTDLEKHAHESFENCGKVCEADKQCFQWVFYEKTCKLGMSFRLGKYMAPNENGEVVWKSGWKVERNKRMDREKCLQGAIVADHQIVLYLAKYNVLQ